MPVHFIHISKTGGSAIKDAFQAIEHPETKYGRLFLHPHPFTLDEVPEDHHVFFTVRDPIARFVSSFYSRLRKGRPKYFRDWTDAEREAFEVFTTPQALALGLVSPSREVRAKATNAMVEIRQLKRDMATWLNGVSLLKRRSDRILYVGRQETLGEDWEKIKDVLGLPSHLILPTDAKTAHQGLDSEDRGLDDAARRALTNWYAKDYRILAYCEKLRSERGWGSPLEGQPSARRLVTAQAGWAVFKVKKRLSRARRA